MEQMGWLCQELRKSSAIKVASGFIQTGVWVSVQNLLRIFDEWPFSVKDLSVLLGIYTVVLSQEAIVCN